jgi:ABC-type transport system involved in multi-copper enzyme maturation permease subunit
MLGTIIKKEILEHLMTLRFALSCLLCLIVLCLGTYVNTQEYRKDLADYNGNVSMHRHELEQYTEPWQVRWPPGVKIDVSINVMRIFAARSGSRGAQVLTINQDDEPQPTETTGLNPVEWLFPRSDMTFFVGVIMSLLALVFSYDSISGEKERGTLRLMLSYSVPRDTVLIAKWVGGYVTLIIPFLLGLLCALVIVMASPDILLTSENWAQIAGMVALSLVYLSAVYSVGMFISARTANSASSAVVALLVWVLLVPIIPTITPYIAADVAPSGSISELAKQKREVILGVWDSFDAAEKKYDLENNIPERWWEKGLDWNSPAILKRRMALEDLTLLSLKKITAEQEKLNTEFLNRVETQAFVGKNISRCSLFSSYMYSLLACAAEDGSGERQKRKLVIDYKYELGDHSSVLEKQWLQARMDGKPKPLLKAAEIPKLRWPGNTITASTRDIFVDVALLLVWNVVFFMGAYMSFLKYDVR